jgi:type IV secretory pathway VirB9-like protein
LAGLGQRLYLRLKRFCEIEVGRSEKIVLEFVLGDAVMVVEVEDMRMRGEERVKFGVHLVEVV